MIRFICGCTAKIEPPITEEIFKTFDSVVYDDEGFMVCLVHHERRIGWRSVPYQATKQPRLIMHGFEDEGPQEIEVSNYTPLEFERFVVFGELAKSKTVNFKTSGQDRRDNRDPVEVAVAHVRHNNPKLGEPNKYLIGKSVIGL